MGLEPQQHQLMLALKGLLGNTPNDSLHEAAAQMLRNNIGRLPVVDRKDVRHVVGYLGRPGIIAARLRRLEEEHVREPGWVRKFRRGCWPSEAGDRSVSGPLSHFESSALGPSRKSVGAETPLLIGGHADSLGSLALSLHGLLTPQTDNVSVSIAEFGSVPLEHFLGWMAERNTFAEISAKDVCTSSTWKGGTLLRGKS
jgi:CBS domain-containing protein